LAIIHQNSSASKISTQLSIFDLLETEKGGAKPARAIPRRRKRNVAHSQSTAEARAISLNQVKSKCGRRHRLILQVLADYGPQTAREVLRRLIAQGHLPPTAERNQTAPRISELADMGAVEAGEVCRVGTDAPAATWAITERGRLLLNHLLREEERSR
jgi:hypothetical protein